jgi:hypothetical protein
MGIVSASVDAWVLLVEIQRDRAAPRKGWFRAGVTFPRPGEAQAG